MICVFVFVFLGGDKWFLFILSIEGSKWVMVFIGIYEKIMLLDIIVILFLRMLILCDME